MSKAPLVAGQVRPRLHRTEAVEAGLLALPYVLIFVFFVLYPLLYGFYMGSDWGSYKRLWSDPVYLRSLRNTLLFLLIGVNLKLFLALLLSGFFAIPRRWIKALGVIFILPWAVPSIPSILSFRWMLNAEWGMLNKLLETIGLTAVPWLNRPDLALGSAIFVHIWKYLPFWTLILLSGRMAISRDIYESAALDGATGVKGFLYITFPLLRNLYLTNTILSTIWTLGDFNSVYLLTGGGPVDRTHVLATLGVRYAFQMAEIKTGVATMITALPIVVPLVVYLVYRLRKGDVV